MAEQMRPSLSALPSPAVQSRLPEGRNLPGESRDARRELPAACEANEQNTHRQRMQAAERTWDGVASKTKTVQKTVPPRPSNTACNGLSVRTECVALGKYGERGARTPFSKPARAAVVQGSAVPNTAAAERRDGAWCVGSRRGSPKALPIPPFPERKNRRGFARGQQCQLPIARAMLCCGLELEGSKKRDRVKGLGICNSAFPPMCPRPRTLTLDGALAFRRGPFPSFHGKRLLRESKKTAQL